MKLIDFLSDGNTVKKILVVSDLGKGQAIVRKYGNGSGRIISNVECKTIQQLANEIFCYQFAEKDLEESVRILESEEALMLFRSVLIENISDMKYFTNEKMIGINTVREIFDKINLIRENKWTSAGENAQYDKINDLKTLIALYEQKLEDGSMMDETELLRFALHTVKGMSDDELRLIIDGEIAATAEAFETSTHLRNDFLKAIKGDKQGTPLFVNIFDKEQEKNPEYDDLKDKAKFFKGYGSINEATFIADDIISNGIPYGDVSVIYTSSTQVPAISAALKGNGVNVCFTAKHAVQDNPYITLIQEILDWAEDNYSEICLERILANPVIKAGLLWSYAYFDYVLNARNRRNDDFALGWGFERNREFLAHEKRLDTKSKKTEMLLLHGALLDIFADESAPDHEMTVIRPYKLFERIQSFMTEYTDKVEAYKPVKNYLYEVLSVLRMEERQLPLDESLKLIRMLLEQISEADKECEDAVKVEQFSDWTILDRPYVYIIGLALKDLQSNAAESPVLSDEEILTLLDCAFSPTVINRAERKVRNLRRTVRTFSGTQISFGFTFYDTVNFQDNNPASFYREMAHLAGIDIAKTTEFVYGNPEQGVHFVKEDIEEAGEDTEETDDDIGEADEDAEEETKPMPIRDKTSCSTYEVLLDCPKKYFFNETIRDSEFFECDHEKWLDPKLFGLYFHEVAEQYTKDQLIPTDGKTAPFAVDEELIGSICEAIRKEYEARIPAAYPELTYKEAAEIKQMATNYFTKLTDEMNESGWRAIAAECKFKDHILSVKDYNGKVHKYSFNGIVDRVDYKADHAKKELLLRVIDYKTGRKGAKKKELAQGKLIQPLIYKHAVMEKGKLLDEIIKEIAKGEQNEEIKEYSIAFEKYYYVFPKELEDTEPLACDTTDETITLSRIRSILTVIETEQFYPNKLELLRILNKKEAEYSKADSSVAQLIEVICSNGDSSELSENEADSCGYCDYKDLCIERKAGLIHE